MSLDSINDETTIPGSVDDKSFRKSGAIQTFDTAGCRRDYSIVNSIGTTKISTALEHQILKH